MSRPAILFSVLVVLVLFLGSACGSEQSAPAPAGAPVPAKGSSGPQPISVGAGGVSPAKPAVAPSHAAAPPAEADLLGRAERTLSSPDEEERAGVIEVLLAAKDRKAAGRIAEKMLGDEVEDIRALAAQTMATIEYAEGATALRAVLGRDESALVRKTALASLFKLTGRTSLPDLLRAVDKDEDSTVRAMAARMAGDLGAAEAGGPLLAKMADEYDPAVRTALVEALRKLKYAKAGPALIEALEDMDVGVRIEAARALGELKERKAVGTLVRVLSPDESGQTLTVMFRALEAITGNEIEFDEVDVESQKAAIEAWNAWWEEHQDEY